MERKIDVWQYSTWAFIGLFLFGVAYLYQMAYQVYFLEEYWSVVLLTVLGLNLFLALWVTRNALSKETLSFVAVLLSFSWIIIAFDAVMPVFIIRSMQPFIAFFPAIFLYFVIQGMSVEKDQSKRNQFFLLVLIILGGVREFAAQLRLLEYSTPFFFINLFLVVLFTVCIFTYERKKGLLRWTKQEMRLVLWASFFSIAPFVFVSIVPSLFRGEAVENRWTLACVLILPIAIGHLISKYNLIIHRYWKISLLGSYLIVLSVFCLVWGTLYVTVELTFLQLVVVTHYLLAIGFTLYVSGILYTAYRKKVVHEKLETFQEEKSLLTYHQLKRMFMEQTLELIEQLFKEKKNYEGFVLYKKRKRQVQKLTERGNIPNVGMDVTAVLEKNNFIVVEESSSCSSAFVLCAYGSKGWKEEEKEQIREEAKQFFVLLRQQEELLKLKNTIEDRPYTALEKSVYLRELDLADLYHHMISRFLHDEVQQNILSLKHMSYTVDSIEEIRERIVEVVAETEQTIKVKTIEWEAYPQEEGEIDVLVNKLFRSLKHQFARSFILTLDVETKSFEQEDRITKSLLYRAIKELMINAFKHAQAEHIRIELIKKQDQWFLRVEDDGRGWSGQINESHRFGLLSLSRQLALFNGELQIETEENEGFTAAIRLPSLLKEGKRIDEFDDYR